MRDSFTSCSISLSSVILIAGLLIAGGCSRARYRVQADVDAYQAIAERNGDPRWMARDYSIDMDSRSRYFDAYDPDRAPMPQDDPASHRYMQIVDGKKGWAHWQDNGQRHALENPGWRDALGQFAQLDENGAVQLDIEAALRLAYLHSPLHQRQLETLYLSALDVTAERFRLDTQIFGGYDVRYAQDGPLSPPQLRYSEFLNRFVITPGVNGIDSSRLTVGRPFAENPALQARRQLATAGELLVGFANSFVFEFSGGDANLAASLANFSFIQPLLRGAGRDVALERLTFEERKLLANLRAYGRFRKGFYTQVAIGELGTSGPQRGGASTSMQSFGGESRFSGYLGLLEQLQQIRNSEANLALQVRTRDRLEALLAFNWTDLVQVDQFRQSVERERVSLLARENSFELALDRYKSDTLGLPPDLPIALDDSLLLQFQLVPSEARSLQNAIIEFQRRVAQMPDVPEVADLEQALADAANLVQPVGGLFGLVRRDLARLNDVMEIRLRSLDAQGRRDLLNERDQLATGLEERLAEYNLHVQRLQDLRGKLTPQTRGLSMINLISWTADFLRNVERLVLIPARARLESITVETVQLEAGDAFQVALANRLDFMNGRAALVDQWRLIQVSADALQSVLNLSASGEIRTARNSPTSFRAPTGSARVGLEFDAPYTRLLERNAYRESLIDYQQSRRELIQSRDSLHLGLRALIRQVEQLRQSLEIQRRAVGIAIRQVDQTQLQLSPPRQPPQPGARVPINNTLAINLLTAQTTLRQTQDAFLNAWLSLYAARMRLYRELGVMVIDADGQWIEGPIPTAEGSGEGGQPEVLPPAVPLPPRDAEMNQAYGAPEYPHPGAGPGPFRHTSQLPLASPQPYRLPPVPSR